LKLREDYGRPLRKGEYPIVCGKKKFLLEADDQKELRLFATMRSEELRPYIEHNITLLMEIEALRRRLLTLGIPEDELRWAKKEACEKVREAYEVPTPLEYYTDSMKSS
jgi:regulator of replication initiation timing